MIDLEKIRRSVGMVGESDKIIELLSLIYQVATNDISVLITSIASSSFPFSIFSKFVTNSDFVNSVFSITHQIYH